MNDSKFLKVLYGVIFLMLVGFFGFGGYFLYHGVHGAGLLAIGIGLIGLGCTVFLGNGLIFAKDVTKTTHHKEYPAGKAVMSGGALIKNIIYNLTCDVDCEYAKHMKGVDVGVADNGFVVNVDKHTHIYIVFSRIKNVYREDLSYKFVGDIERNMNLKVCVLTLTLPNKMKAKMFEKSLQQAGIALSDDVLDMSIDTALSVKSAGVTDTYARRRLSERKKVE
mgnify:CR=1 FL=1